MQNSLFDHFYRIGIIPILEIDRAVDAVPLAQALQAGGLPIAEVTLRTGTALEAIERIARDVPEVLVGAGTVLNREQARAAREAGAHFLVSPGLVEEVVLWAQESQVPVLAGAVTPTEMIRAIALGLEVLKFFPAEAMGGLKTLRSLSDPFPQLRFVPTGGIHLENAASYLADPRVLAVGGSWMAQRQRISEGRFDEITQLATEASRLVEHIRRPQTS